MLSEVYFVLCYVSHDMTQDIYGRSIVKKRFNDMLLYLRHRVIILYSTCMCTVMQKYCLLITFVSQLVQGSKAHFIALRYNFNKSR